MQADEGVAVREEARVAYELRQERMKRVGYLR